MKSVCGVLSLSFCTTAVASHLSCKSDAGKNVDFSYAFKYPNGFDYAYMDSHKKLSQASHDLDSEHSSVSQTLMQMHSSGVSYVMWNDEPPTGHASAAPNAHAKGALLFNKDGGVWLTHSLPHFPTEAKSVSGMWKKGSKNYGQSFLCITVSAAEIHKLVPMFKITRPTIYGHHFDSHGKKEFAELEEMSKGGRYHWDKDTMTTEVSIKSKGGEHFHAYGKNGKWGTKKDLYHDFVAESEGNLFFEGWRHGAGVWGPACGKHQVVDIMEVSYPGQDWTVMQDHSKWAVSQRGSTFCVGDLNRAKGQDKRGGATVCIKSGHFASEMRKVISKKDKCRSMLEEESVVMV